MEIIRTLISLVIFFAIIGALLFFIGTFALIALVVLPFIILARRKMKTDIVQEKTIDVEFKRVD